MDAKRLEELAAWAQSLADWCAGKDLPPEIGSKYADLARCARAWVALERRMQESEQVSELYGYRGREQPWSFYADATAAFTRYTGHTAIEAVEAAEGKR